MSQVAFLWFIWPVFLFFNFFFPLNLCNGNVSNNSFLFVIFNVKLICFSLELMNTKYEMKNTAGNDKTTIYGSFSSHLLSSCLKCLVLSDLLGTIMFKSKERKLKALTEKWLSIGDVFRLIFIFTTVHTAANKCQKQNASLPQAFF